MGTPSQTQPDIARFQPEVGSERALVSPFCSWLSTHCPTLGSACCSQHGSSCVLKPPEGVDLLASSFEPSVSVPLHTLAQQENWNVLLVLARGTK